MPAFRRDDHQCRFIIRAAIHPPRLVQFGAWTRRGRRGYVIKTHFPAFDAVDIVRPGFRQPLFMEYCGRRHFDLSNHSASPDFPPNKGSVWSCRGKTLKITRPELRCGPPA